MKNNTMLHRLYNEIFWIGQEKEVTKRYSHIIAETNAAVMFRVTGLMSVSFAIISIYNAVTDMFADWLTYAYAAMSLENFAFSVLAMLAIRRSVRFEHKNREIELFICLYEVIGCISLLYIDLNLSRKNIFYHFILGILPLSCVYAKSLFESFVSSMMFVLAFELAASFRIPLQMRIINIIIIFFICFIGNLTSHLKERELLQSRVIRDADLAAEAEYYKTVTQKQKQISIIRHDMKHYKNVIENFIETGKTEELRKLFS